MNRVVLVGRLTAAPAIRNGRVLLTLAIDDTIVTTYCAGTCRDAALEFLDIGREVALEGRLDGNEVVVERLQLLGRRRPGEPQSLR